MSPGASRDPPEIVIRYPQGGGQVNILPIVVPLTYFTLPANSPVPAGIEAFGIVRRLGNDVASLLVNERDGMLKNVHREDLAKEGIDPDAAEQLALDNLSSLIKSGEFKAQVTKDTPAGYNYAVWFGNRFTSSCILWPGLYEWARKQLGSDQLIACSPQNQIMCVASRGDAEFRSNIGNHLNEVVKDMGKLISPAWFELTPSGLAPLSAP